MFAHHAGRLGGFHLDVDHLDGCLISVARHVDGWCFAEVGFVPSSVVALARWLVLLLDETGGGLGQPHGPFFCHGLAP